VQNTYLLEIPRYECVLQQVFFSEFLEAAAAALGGEGALIISSTVTMLEGGG
jgi:hypothetical protein